MKGIKFIPVGTNINFTGMRYGAFVLSALMLICAIGLLFAKGLNFGIDFTGGTAIEIKLEEAPDLQALRADLNALDLGAISIQEFGAADDLLIRLPESADQKGAVETVQAALNTSFERVDYRRVEFVGPQVGEELQLQGLQAILFSLAGILAYIWFRFEWQFGIAAILALVHDCVAILGLFALTRMEFNLSTVAAILMVAGYSINDTVVVFDRIREDLRRYKKKPLPELFNMSINMMLERTLMTSVTTFLTSARTVYFWRGGAARLYRGADRRCSDRDIFIRIHRRTGAVVL